jgi:predicted nucleotidyltransferase
VCHSGEANEVIALANIVEEKLPQLRSFCERHDVAKLSLFGSVLRREEREDSDIDFLVEFKAGARKSLFDLGGMIMELRELFGRDVDLRTPGDLSPYFRDDVVRTARLLYAA